MVKGESGTFDSKMPWVKNSLPQAWRCRWQHEQCCKISEWGKFFELLFFVNKWSWWLGPLRCSKKMKKTANVTVPIKMDQIKLIAEAKPQGELFHATGSSHLTGDDFFKAMEVPVWAKKIKFLKDEKKKRLQLEKNEAEGKEVLPVNKQMDHLNAIELEVPKKEMGNKKEKLIKWKSILSSNQLPLLFKNGVLLMRINLNNFKRAKLIWLELHLGNKRKSISRKLAL